MTPVDTNVLLDVLTGNPDWAAWSVRQLEMAAVAGPLLINDIVYAELAVGYADIADLEDVVRTMTLRLDPFPRPALFLAAKAFQQYRKRGGTRTGVLPDFFIGAHAAVAGIPLLTRDVRRYRRYFPTVRVIGPEGMAFNADRD